MKKVLYLDIEWANSKNKSICQIGLVSEDFETEEPIFPELNLYINPDCKIKHHLNTQIVFGFCHIKIRVAQQLACRPLSR